MASKIVLDKKTIARLEISNLKLKESKLLEKRNVSVLKSNREEEDPMQEINDEGIITYVIVSPYDLDCGEPLRLEKNSILKFEGDGKILNGTVIGDNSTIIADNKVFYDVNVEGTWKCVGNVAWFADATDLETFDCSSAEDKSSDIQKALDSSFRELTFPPVAYYISNTLNLTKEKKLRFQGKLLKNSITDDKNAAINTSILFTCNNIPLLHIAVNENKQNRVEIEGGNFDVSMAKFSYSSNCIEIFSNNEEKMWGVYINSSILGYVGGATAVNSGVGVNINPVRSISADTVENSEDIINGYYVINYDYNEMGYITDIRINGVIANFATGIKAFSYENTKPVCTVKIEGGQRVVSGTYAKGLWPYNWCSDIRTDCEITNCEIAVESDVSPMDIRGTLQTGKLFGNEKKQKPLILYKGDTLALGGAIFDVGLNEKVNSVALEMTKPNSYVDFYGDAMTFVSGARRNYMSDKLPDNPIKLYNGIDRDRWDFGNSSYYTPLLVKYKEGDDMDDKQYVNT